MIRTISELGSSAKIGLHQITQISSARVEQKIKQNNGAGLRRRGANCLILEVSFCEGSCSRHEARFIARALRAIVNFAEL